MKYVLAMLVVGAMGSISYADHHKDGHKGPKMNDEQRACVEAKLGPKEEGQRPSWEEKKAAFSECGVDTSEWKKHKKHKKFKKETEEPSGAQ